MRRMTAYIVVAVIAGLAAGVASVSAADDVVSYLIGAGACLVAVAAALAIAAPRGRPVRDAAHATNRVL